MNCLDLITEETGSCNEIEALIHWGRVTHICVSRLSPHWFRVFCLFGAKPLSEPVFVYCQSDAKEHISSELKRKFNQSKAFENVVCKMAVVLYRTRCVKAKTHLYSKLIWIWITIVKRPRTLLVQFVKLYKLCKPYSELKYLHIWYK